MVYSPSLYLVASAVATIALQMQQTTASSMYHEPVTISIESKTLSGISPVSKKKVPEKSLEYEWHPDPTLPNITAIASVPVEHLDLLSTNSIPPLEFISTRVGVSILAEPIPANLDAYVTTSWLPVSINQPETSKHGADDCATGWDEPKTTHKLLDDETVEDPMRTKRHLEATPNANLDMLEAYYGIKLDLTLANLPEVSALAEIPWPAPYWPDFQDSINVVWNEGQPSASEKYARAFGLDVKKFQDMISKENGVEYHAFNTQCKATSDCKPGSECGIRDGAESGYCIEGWWGLCHGWTPASILEHEPNCPVTYNGITFEPLDLKALLIYVHGDAFTSISMIGSRYEGDNTLDVKDKFGRSTSPAYSDLNPAFFHISLTNVLGKLNTSFIIDTECGEQVWNQPLRGFKVFEQTAFTLKKAAKTFYGVKDYPFNADAKSIVYMKTRVTWLVETYENGDLVRSGRVDKYTEGAFYHYLLELDGAGEIIGGEWVYDSKTAHPDFLWFVAYSPPADKVLKNGLSYADVSMLLNKAVACSD